MNKSKIIGFRPTWAEIDLKNLIYNFAKIKKLVAGKKIMACVKADGYGHGIIAVSKKLADCGVDYFGVASIDEGIALRQKAIKQPILVLGVVLKEYIAPFFQYDLMATVCTHEMASCLNRHAQRLGKVMRIHVKVDTGMGRIGVAWQEAADFIISLQKYPYLKIEGVFTHLACADTKKQYTREQLRIFNSVLSKVRDNGISIPLVHAANSMGVISYPQSHFTMARPGLMVYGLYPGNGLDVSLKPVLSLKSKVVFVKRVPEGCGISYGHTYVTKRATTIVTLPVGYGDGYPRLLSNVGPVLIGGRRFTISGRVCMDQIMVDVGNARVKVGDPVVLIGAQGNERITVEELACLCDTIPYEIVCGLGSRIPRVYI